MFQRISGFFRRLFGNKGFRRACWVFLGLFVVYYLYNMALFLQALIRAGFTLRYAIRVVLRTPLVFRSISPFWSVLLGVFIGLAWFFYRKWKNTETEKTEEKEPEVPSSVSEEDFPDTNRHMYQ